LTGTPLEGIRVLDLSRIASGPLTTMLMADLGADVIKVERPGTGDELRSMGSPLPGCDALDSDYYVALNRSKRSIAVDISMPDGLAVVKMLAARSDVVVENFRPGVADRIGVGFDALRTLRTGLVFASISGFGSSGPWADRPANDVMMQSISGLMGVTGERGGPPVRLGSSISDFASGLYALAGVLAALFARERHPEGQHIEVPMLDSSIAMMPNLVPTASLGKRIPRLGRGHPQIVGYAAFECSDGRYVTVGAFSEAFWRRLCAVIGHEDWLADVGLASNAARIERRAMIDVELERVFRTRSAAEWFELLQRADVPCSPVLELDEAIVSEQAIHNGVLWWLRHGDNDVGVARNPIRSAQWNEYAPVPAPGLGAQSRDVLSGLLGMSDEAIDALLESGAVA
jgi:crotonobetainyl-CoA:carnitine CoA-transferase CaiB-like acyl-CoA transferase